MSPPPQPQEHQRRRKGRKAPTDTNTPDDSAQTDEGSVKARPRSNNKKKNESALTQALNAGDGSITPPRAADGSAHNDNAHRNTRKGKKNGQQGANQHSTPGPKHHRQPNGTPRQVAMDAYAGPTFHASPAPSALPIPKMFSKSAPAVDNDVGITARLAQEEGSTSSGSDGTPDSPSNRPSTRVASGGPAMFDFLLNADRQEKARQLHGQTLSPPRADTRDNSVSPVHQQTVHRPKHSRTLTDSEISTVSSGHFGPRDSPSPAISRQVPPFAPTPPYSNSPYQQPSNDGSLQRMLFSSPQQGPPVNNFYAVPAQTQWNSSPASAATGSPYTSPASSNGLASSSRPAPVSPYTQASPSPSARRPGYPQYSNSGLRRELAPDGLNHTPPPLGNLPRYNAGYAGHSPLASPVQQRFAANNSSFPGPGYNSPDRNTSPTASNRRFSAQDALKSLGGGGQMSEMEDRLRQILKIDALRPQGNQSPSATAVPS